MLGSTVYYGDTDGFLHSRSFDGSELGSDTKIDPYHDATWDGVANGSGGTYDGSTVALYGELNQVTGMFYSGGRLYYTLYGQSDLYYRYFTPDSGVVGADEFTASGGLNWSDGGGMFLSSGTLYFVARSTGALWSVPFTNGAPSGTPIDVNDPATGGNNWNAHALFLGPQPPPNQPPVAAASVTCPGLGCTFDGGGSSDPDGTIADYAWTFGDGATGDGESVPHTYGQAGVYDWTLTVTDNDGATDQTSGSVTVNDPADSSISYVGSAGGTSNTKTPGATIPSSGQPGDLLVLEAAVNSSTVSISNPTGVTGWTSLGAADANGLKSVVWWKIATAGDIGTKVTVPLGSGIKSSVQVLDYRGVDADHPVDVSASAVDTAASASHETPTVGATSGDWVVSLWTDKSSGTTQWTPPGSVTPRDTEYSTGTGYVSALAADSGTGVGSVPYGGLIATTNVAGGKGTMWTIAVAPDQP